MLRDMTIVIPSTRALASVANPLAADQPNVETHRDRVGGIPLPDDHAMLERQRRRVVGNPLDPGHFIGENHSLSAGVIQLAGSHSWLDDHLISAASNILTADQTTHGIHCGPVGGFLDPTGATEA